MKEGWEIKKLGEVCDILNGFAFKSQLFKENGEDVLRISNIQNGYIDLTDVAHFCKEDYPKVYFEKYAVLPNDIVVALSGATTGKFGINNTGKILYLNQRVAICRENTKCLNHLFLLYYLNVQSKSFLESAAGVAQPNLSTEQMKQFDIPIPPLSEQSKIVSELDCLSSIIEKKKQQLKELDALSQSIFYEMFGNPVENERGWEVKKLGEVSEVTSFKRVLIEDVVESGIPFIRGTELSALSKLPNSKDYQFTLFITPEHYERVKAISGVPKIGDLLIPSINSEGLIWELDTEEPRYYKDGRVLWIHTNHQYSNSKTLKYIISNKLRLMYRELASGATFIELKLFVLRDMLLPFPPLNLQKEFASKIESIEQQKALIKKSIAEVETLFNSRMDFYFN